MIFSLSYYCDCGLGTDSGVQMFAVLIEPLSEVGDCPALPHPRDAGLPPDRGRGRTIGTIARGHIVSGTGTRGRQGGTAKNISKL